jgi:hypothetical protein
MKQNVLTNLDEPTDIELVALMDEVLTEAKQKFATVNIQLQNKVKEEIEIAQAKYNVKKK